MINNKEEIINALKEQNILNSEWKNTLVIGDVHFGIKTNSVTWLEAQLEFFNKQVIPAIKEKHIDRVIFLGDIFDIRYAVNQQVGIEVKSLVRKLSLFSSIDL